MKMQIVNNTFVKVDGEMQYVPAVNTSSDGKPKGPNVVDVPLDVAKQLFASRKAVPIDREKFMKAVKDGKG